MHAVLKPLLPVVALGHPSHPVMIHSGQLLGPIRDALDLLAKESKEGQATPTPAALQTPAQQRLKIGIVGFGKFGQFLAKTFTKHAEVFVVDKDDQVRRQPHSPPASVRMTRLVSPYLSSASRGDQSPLASC